MSINSNNFKKLIIFFLLLFLVIILSNLNEFGMFYLRLSAENTNYSISYQGYARVLSILGLLSLALAKNSYSSILLYFIVSIILFFNGARTEFILFNFTSIIFFILFIPRTIYLLVLILIITLVVISQSDTLLNLVFENRLLELIIDPSNSTSGNVRFDTILVALQTISSHPLFGDYGSYIQVGGIGYYAHSLISAWVNLGLFGFMLYLSIFFLMFIYLYLYRYKKSFIEYKLFFLFLLFTFTAMLVSKNYSYMLMGFLVAFYSRSAHVK